jgi:hypothetical protein
VALEEERISDLFCATLNGAFVRADREVFIGGGRSDIYVQASTLNLSGTADVFAGEVKYWDGEKHLLEAGSQTLDNLTQRTRSALLVVLVKNRESFQQATESGHTALIESVATAADPLAERPTYKLPSRLDPALTVRLCVIYVDLTVRGDRLPRPKGRGSRRRDGVG